MHNYPWLILLHLDVCFGNMEVNNGQPWMAKSVSFDTRGR